MSKAFDEGMNKINEGVQQVVQNLPTNPEGITTTTTGNGVSTSTISSSSHHYGSTEHDGVVTSSYDYTTATPTKNFVNGVEVSGQTEPAHEGE